MATAHIKKVIRIGGSLAIILPSRWARNKIKAGQEMVVVGNSGLHMFPVYGSEKIQQGRDKDGTTSEV